MWYTEEIGGTWLKGRPPKDLEPDYIWSKAAKDLVPVSPAAILLEDGTIYDFALNAIGVSPWAYCDEDTLEAIRYATDQER